MGRKKGRQSGNFKSKSMRAAYQWELRERASEVLPMKNKPSHGGGGGMVGGGGSGQLSCMALSRMASRMSAVDGSRPKLTIGLAQLRGLLAERTMEDRLLDREMRRRRVNANSSGINGSYGSFTGYGGTGTTSSTTTRTVPVCQRHEPGWLLHYRNNDDDAQGETPVHSSLPSSCPVPSLQTLSVRALAPLLSHYVDACGSETIHSALTILPCDLIADLSAEFCHYSSHADSSRPSSRDHVYVDDELASVLGCHPHLERLALHAAPLSLTALDLEDIGDDHDDVEEEEEEEEETKYVGLYNEKQARRTTSGRRRLTDQGILNLVPRLISSSSCASSSLTYKTITNKSNEFHDSHDESNNVNDNNMTTTPRGPDSWEEIDIDFDIKFHGCATLKRFELANARHVSIMAMTTFIRRCSSITHLSISNSFTDTTGPGVLLHPQHGILSSCLLVNLQVLDVSHCYWMNDAILVEAVRKLFATTKRNLGREGECNYDDGDVDDDACVGGKQEGKCGTSDNDRGLSSSLQMLNVAGCTNVTIDVIEVLNQQLGGEKPIITTTVQTWKKEL